MDANDLIHHRLQAFAEAVKAKTAVLVLGQPEEQLRAPFESFVVGAATDWNWEVVCVGEASLPDRLGRPDYAVERNRLLAGYVELKAPGAGANAGRFRGRDRDQFKRFSEIPNLLYTDGNEWALYRSGERAGAIVRFSGDITVDGRDAVSPEDARAAGHLLRNFLDWEPFLPLDRRGKIDLKGFAALLAPQCRMLRDDVTEALSNAHSSLTRLATDWRELLFPAATDAQFADAYAQTVAFALLLGRSIGADPLTLQNTQDALSVRHSLLSRALQVLTDPQARTELATSLDLLLRVVGIVPPATLASPGDPWLYFYEDFLAAYDPKLRKDAGAYYTPVEVVRTQVRLIDELLVERYGRQRGFADNDVVTLDPAAGTGTYLLAVIEHVLAGVEAKQGTGAVPGQASALAKNLYGFELMVGPYAVAELRVTRALRDYGAELPAQGPHIYLSDTLESPHATPAQLPLFLQPIADQRARALEVKRDVPVLVCLGNPPYDRHEAATGTNGERTGSWVRWGDDGKGGRGAILHDFIAPATSVGYGIQLKNLYNLYVYFWRWALWKVFEQNTEGGPGIVSFITASSYLDGDAFVGMREHMRRSCDEIWILDLGGEGRGTRRSENVFAIQTPVAVAVAARAEETKRDAPAKVRYARIDGSRTEKLAMLNTIDSFAKVEWQDCPDDWHAPFRPAGEGEYFTWPLLTDLMPWQHSGVQFKRTWPIAPDAATLERRWRALLASPGADLSKKFKETRDRKVDAGYVPLLKAEQRRAPISELPSDTPTPQVKRYAYRSFDRQWILADTRLADYLRPDLWRAHGERQVYFTSLLSAFLGVGPSLIACAMLPDLHHFSGRGAKDTLPLYRTSDASEPNILPGLLDQLTKTYGREITPEDFAAYLYGVLAHPAFAKHYSEQLETRELRVPMTRDRGLFEALREAGVKLLRLHSYGDRFVPDGEPRGRVPTGSARCTKAVPGNADDYPESFRHDAETRTLHVGQGEFAGVAPEVFEFEVSGLKVVQSWLRYRMKNGAGRKSSPLDNIRPERWTSEFTTELLELLWVLETTVEGYPKQQELLESVLAGDCFRADELPVVPDEMRKLPKAQTSKNRVNKRLPL